MCVRLRAKGWEIWRLDAEMTLHDAAMMRFGQFWKRAKRGGYSCAQGAALNGAPPERRNIKETRRILAWGVMLPAAITLSTLIISKYSILLTIAYPLQIIRVAENIEAKSKWAISILLLVGKIPEAQGAMKYYWDRISGQKTKLIEYK
jgi:hypothetical protein